MDSMSAFAMGMASRGKPQMVFDWDKAAIKEHKAKNARAGLCGDWEWTGGDIFIDGKPDLESYTYLTSTWATPEIDIDGEVMNCFIMENDVPVEWGTDFASIKWPNSALVILNE